MATFVMNIFAKSSVNITVQVRDFTGAAVTTGTYDASWGAYA